MSQTYPDGVRTKPTPPSAGESYFATCGRDDGGHCLPAGGSAGGKSPPPPLGPSKATVVFRDAEEEADVVRVAKKFFGTGGSPRDFADCVGAPEGHEVHLSVTPNRRFVEVRVDGPVYHAQRAFGFVDGEKVIQNESSRLKPGVPTGSGVGEEIFARQVENAAKAGFAYIETTAAGGAGTDMNGYYTWPRFGFDAPFSEKETARFPEMFKGATRLSDLMATPEGRDYWRAHGGQVDLAFDLKEGSLSRRVLGAYRKQRAVREQRGG